MWIIDHFTISEKENWGFWTKMLRKILEFSESTKKTHLTRWEHRRKLVHEQHPALCTDILWSYSTLFYGGWSNSGIWHSSLQQMAHVRFTVWTLHIMCIYIAYHMHLCGITAAPIEIYMCTSNMPVLSLIRLTCPPQTCLFLWKGWNVQGASYCRVYESMHLE